jgi:MarR family transcriptional regulator for hemolysin
VRRRREAGNRRVQRVELTAAGGALFDRLRDVVVAHDRRLRSALGDAEVEQLAALLDRLRAAVAP